MAVSSMTGTGPRRRQRRRVAVDLRAQDRQRQGPGHSLAHARALRSGGRRGARTADRQGAGARDLLRQSLPRSGRGRPLRRALISRRSKSIAVAARAAAVKAGLAPPTMDGLLALRGVLEAVDIEDDEAAVDAAACAGALLSLDEAIAALTAARRGEGGALAHLLETMLAAIAGLVEAADANPGRRPEAVRERLAQSIQTLMEFLHAASIETASTRRRCCLRPGRHPRGTRPAQDPRRRRAGADRPRRADRPAARFPGPGAGAGGEHALRQGQ